MAQSWVSQRHCDDVAPQAPRDFFPLTWEVALGGLPTPLFGPPGCLKSLHFAIRVQFQFACESQKCASITKQSYYEQQGGPQRKLQASQTLSEARAIPQVRGKAPGRPWCSNHCGTIKTHAHLAPGPAPPLEPLTCNPKVRVGTASRSSPVLEDAGCECP